MRLTAGQSWPTCGAANPTKAHPKVATLRTVSNSLQKLSLQKTRGLPPHFFRISLENRPKATNKKRFSQKEKSKKQEKNPKQKQLINEPKKALYISLFSCLNCLFRGSSTSPPHLYLFAFRRCSMPENGYTTTKTDIWTFIELLRHRISYGYIYYYIFHQKKPQKNNEIAKYYLSHLKKYQRTYRRHVLGLRNYFYMYFQGIGIVLATEGQPDPSLQHIEQFLQDIRQKPLHLKVSDITELIIHAQPRANKKTLKVNIYLSKETIRIIKSNLLQTLKQYANPSKKEQKQAKNAVRKAWLINGYPSFCGLLEQKKQLRKWYVKEARIRGINIPAQELKLSYFRKNRLKKT